MWQASKVINQGQQTHTGLIGLSSKPDTVLKIR